MQLHGLVLIFGDPRHSEPLGPAVAALIDRARQGAPETLLILCGELEQAIEDSLPESAPAQQIRAATDRAADLLFGNGSRQSVIAALSPLATRNETVEVRVPEGFAFYALSPRDYFPAAESWLEKHRHAKRVCVIGLRTIGTSLSAAVAAVLRVGGLFVDRFTLRPAGDPFSRRASVKIAPDTYDALLVVDAGPGLSGSSLASIADALQKIGFAEGKVAFFTGHDARADRESRETWSKIERHSAQQKHKPAARPSRRGMFDRPSWSSGDTISELYGAVAAPGFFETRAEAALKKLQKLAERGFVPWPIFERDGWITSEFHRGETIRDVSLLIPRAGDYLACNHGDPLGPEQLASSEARLFEMAKHNASLLREKLEIPEIREPEFEEPSYCDGDLSFDNWLFTRGGILKLDPVGYDDDHTLIGKQSISWSIASAAVEWSLSQNQLADLVHAVSKKLRFDPARLPLHLAAYKMFRAGQNRWLRELGS